MSSTIPNSTTGNDPEVPVLRLQDSNGTKVERSTSEHLWNVQVKKRLATCWELFRVLGLRTLRQATRWKAPIEERKIAIHENACVAFYHILLHIIPLGGAITLLVLNFTKYFVGAEAPNSTALQFIAKLHELLMQASLLEIVLAINRAQAVTGYIPLGAFSASLQSLHLSYLWSLEYLSQFSRKYRTKQYDRIVLLGLVPMLIILAALVGPSSAILMIPRDGSMTMRPKISTLYTSPETRENPDFSSDIPTFTLGANQSKFFHPLRSQTGDDHYVQNELREMFYSWNWTKDPFEGKDTHLVHQITNDDMYTSRLMQYSFQGLDLIGPPMDKKPAQTSQRLAEFYMPTASSTYLLWAPKRPLGNLNFSITIETMHPLVKVSCTSHNTAENLAYVDARTGATQQLGNLNQLISGVVFQNMSQYLDVNASSLLWLSSPQHALDLSVGMIFNFNRCGSLQRPFPMISQMVSGRYNSTNLRSCMDPPTVCSAASFWAAGVDTMTIRQGLQVLQSSRLPPRQQNERLIPIRLGQQFLQMLVDYGWVFPDQRQSTSPSPDIHNAGLLATLIGNNLANIALPRLENAGPTAHYGSEALYLKLWEYGFGYSMYSYSVILSLTVITTYATITIGYILYLIKSGRSSTAWDTAVEMFFLALQSRKPDNLGHTSVGLDTMETFQQNVGIRVNDQEELEIIFENDSDVDKRGLRKIVPNQAY